MNCWLTSAEDQGHTRLQFGLLELHYISVISVEIPNIKFHELICIITLRLRQLNKTSQHNSEDYFTQNQIQERTQTCWCARSVTNAKSSLFQLGFSNGGLLWASLVLVFPLSAFTPRGNICLTFGSEEGQNTVMHLFQHGFRQRCMHVCECVLFPRPSLSLSVSFTGTRTQTRQTSGSGWKTVPLRCSNMAAS